MKRIITAVAFLIMMFLCDTVCAADWDEYTAEEDGFVFERYVYDGENTLIWNSEGLLLERDGVLLRKLTLEENWLIYGIHVLPNGSCGLLMWDTPDIYQRTHLSFHVWDDRGLTLIRTWDGMDLSGEIGNHGILVGDRTGEAVFCDFSGKELWRGSLGIDTITCIYSLTTRSETDWACSLCSMSDPRDCYVRIIDGQIAFQRIISSLGERCIPLQDGMSLLVKARQDGEYGPVTVKLLNRKGDIIKTRQLTGDRLVIGSTRPLELEDGTVVIYGSAVANSRQVYLVWQLTLDTNLDLLGMDVRDCSYHRDYSPGLTVYQDRSCSIGLRAFDNSGASDVLVPYGDLQVCTDHTLKYE